MIKKIASLTAAGGLLLGLIAAGANADTQDASMNASHSESAVHLNLNGVEVADPAAHNMNGTVYVSVDAFAKYYSAKTEFDESTKALKLNGKTVPTAYGAAHMAGGMLMASIRAMAEAIGEDHFEIGWAGDTSTVNLAILPAGVIKLTPSVPQMGEHWANPKDMPLGPIYGVSEGKLVFLEYMPAKDLDKTVHDVPGTLVPIPAKVDHFDIDWNPNGHEGYEVPHYDMHLYFVSRDEQNKIGGAERH